MTQLRGADLRSHTFANADLTNADLRDADLRGVTLSGADLRGANLCGARLHGADLSDTAVGRCSLGHVGGDPELEWIYDPIIEGAFADDSTRWPDGFDVSCKGIIYDGPPELVITVTDRTLQCPVQSDSPIRSDRPPHVIAAVVTQVHSWSAAVRTETGETKTVTSGYALLAHNLELVVGQHADYDGRWWRVIGCDQVEGELTLAANEQVVVVAVQDLSGNVNRWWWHVKGAECRPS